MFDKVARVISLLLCGLKWPFQQVCLTRPIFNRIWWGIQPHWWGIPFPNFGNVLGTLKSICVLNLKSLALFKVCDEGFSRFLRFTTASDEGLDICFFRGCTCMLTTYQCCEGHKSMSKARVMSLFNRIFKPHFYILTKLSITSKPHGRGA